MKSSSLVVLLLDTALALGVAIDKRAAGRALAALTAEESPVVAGGISVSDDLLAVVAATHATSKEQEDGSEQHCEPGGPGPSEGVST